MVYYINRTAAEMAENVKGKNSIAVHYIKGRVYIGDDKKYIGGYNDVKKGFNAYVVCDGVAVYFQNDNSSCESYERFGTMRAAALAIAVAHIVGNAITSFIDAVNVSADWSIADEAQAADIAADYELAEVSERVAEEAIADTYTIEAADDFLVASIAIEADEEAYLRELEQDIEREAANEKKLRDEFVVSMLIANEFIQIANIYKGDEGYYNVFVGNSNADFLYCDIVFFDTVAQAKRAAINAVLHLSDAGIDLADMFTVQRVMLLNAEARQAAGQKQAFVNYEPNADDIQLCSMVKSDIKLPVVAVKSAGHISRRYLSIDFDRMQLVDWPMGAKKILEDYIQHQKKLAVMGERMQKSKA